MARQHGKDTVIKVNNVDISVHCSNSQMQRKADSHDSTGYGVNDYTYKAGLKGGTLNLDGNYDTSAVTGPGVVLDPLIGAEAVPVVRRVQGTGSGKPQQAFNAQVVSYQESSPYNDIVKWSAELTISGAVDATPQP